MTASGSEAIVALLYCSIHIHGIIELIELCSVPRS